MNVEMMPLFYDLSAEFIGSFFFNEQNSASPVRYLLTMYAVINGIMFRRRKITQWHNKRDKKPKRRTRKKN